MSEARVSPQAIGSASGKVILFGEHAVVYGRRAVAAALDRHLTVRAAAGWCEHGEERLERAVRRASEMLGLAPGGFAVSVESELPAGVGLGSSAALSVALVRALSCLGSRRVDDRAVCAMAFEIEKIFHGFPSGVDNTVATYGGLVAFRKGGPLERIAAASPLPLVIALGRAPRRTGEAVAALRRRWSAEPARHEQLFDEVDSIAHEGIDALRRGDLLLLGRLMDANQMLLGELGISTAELDAMVELGRSHGALGAKLTGGGGGGAIICLCPENRGDLLAAYARAGWQAFAAEIGGAREDGAGAAAP